MEIVLDKKDSTNATLKVSLQEPDYLPAIQEKLKDYTKKVSLKGFRPGKVPPALINKMYGKSIKVDEINNLLSAKVTEYIRENKINIIGDPIPSNEEAEGIDWDTQKEFQFTYTLGLVPDFSYELSDKVKLTQYQIEADEKAIEETLNNLRSQFGQMVDGDNVAEGDFLNGELKAKVGEFTTNTILPMNKVAADQQKLFIGKKKDDKISFVIEKAFTDSAEVAYVTGLTKDEAANTKGEFEFTISGIRHSQIAELDQEFFDKVFGKDLVTTEADFRTKLSETMSSNYSRESENLLARDLRNFFVKNTKIELPEDFLKRWLVVSNSNLTTEQVENEFSDYADELKWNLIKNKIAEDNSIKVENEDVLSRTKDMIKEQFGGLSFGGEELDETLNKIADNYLKQENGRSYMKMFETVLNDKVTALIREKAKLETKKISIDEFKKHAEME